MPDLSQIPAQTIFWVLVSALDAYAIARAVARGHGVEGTLAWVFAILALPGLGAVAYLALASPSIKLTTKRKRLTRAFTRSVIDARLPGSATRHPRFAPEPDSSLLRLAASLTGLLPTKGNSVQLLVENDEAFREIERALEGARRTIWAEYYIIQRDETGHRFLDLLARKARQGIQVRLLYDAVGSLHIDAGRIAAIVAAGGHAEVFLPVNPLRRRWAVHLRNHRKMVIVDSEIGFTGGMNVGDEYSGRLRKKGGQFFRDSHLQIRGPAVADLAIIFSEDWSFATGEPVSFSFRPAPVRGATSVVAVVPSGPDQEHNANRLVYFSAVATARERVYLTSPYFIPDQPLVQAMISAAMRGVDVRLLIPAAPDVALVGPAARSYFWELVRGGVRVFEYLPSMLHAKTMVVDGKFSVVGSANVDMRSFRLNFELGALIYDANVGVLLEERFCQDLAASREVTLRTLGKMRFPTRVMNGFARLLSPVL